MKKRFFKSKKSLAGASKYRPWKEWTVGDLFIGRFVGQSEDQFGNPSYKFKVIECEFSDSDAEYEEGETVTLNSCGSLNTAMEEAVEGNLVQVIYQGTTTLQKGKFAGKDCHTLEVDLVEEAEEVEVEDDVL